MAAQGAADAQAQAEAAAEARAAEVARVREQHEAAAAELEELLGARERWAEAWGEERACAEADRAALLASLQARVNCCQKHPASAGSVLADLAGQQLGWELGGALNIWEC